VCERGISLEANVTVLPGKGRSFPSNDEGDQAASEVRRRPAGRDARNHSRSRVTPEKLTVNHRAEGEHSRSRDRIVVTVSQCGGGHSDGEERTCRAIGSRRGRNRMEKTEFLPSRNERIPRKAPENGDDLDEAISSEFAEGLVEEPRRPSERRKTT